MNQKFLYFATATAPDSTESTEEVVMIPADHLSHFEMQSATRVKIFFTTAVAQEGGTQTGTDRTVVALDVTSGKHKEAFADLAATINSHPNSDGFIVIADEANSIYCSTHITLCAGIDLIDAS